jgi:phospholipid-binding lipoprotein MlaA
VSRLAAALAVVALLAAAPPARADAPADPLVRPDPLEPLNRYVYRFNANLDRWVLLPVVRVYDRVLPRLARRGVSHFFSNLGEVPTFANSVLQLSPRKSAGTLARFVVNSTVGVAGVWDPASRIGLHGYDEDFGQTLGHYGVPPGPYLVLPLFGPSSLRDATGLAADRAAMWGFEVLLVGDLATVASAVFPVEVVSTRSDNAFRYGELGPFEYDLVRYLYLEYRRALVEE